MVLTVGLLYHIDCIEINITIGDTKVLDTVFTTQKSFINLNKLTQIQNTRIRTAISWPTHMARYVFDNLSNT